MTFKQFLINLIMVQTVLVYFSVSGGMRGQNKKYIFLALLSGYLSSQYLIDSCPKLLSMFVYMFEMSKVASILCLLAFLGTFVRNSMSSLM